MAALNLFEPRGTSCGWSENRGGGDNPEPFELFLPSCLCPPRREAIYAVYAYCRVIDDIVDSDDPVAQRVRACAVEDELRAAFSTVSRNIRSPSHWLRPIATSACYEDALLVLRGCCRFAQAPLRHLGRTV